ncbi:hypothetical protein A0H81_13219 [Grifola frondosa]|uniref:Uncharacterized protein n=1 Tax=Grifola frondosa TaxID=5627 RepID=A0A1C7LVQ1_GRIFR|nr:hypothetical protein A0H81_13219 [Grifola frondosa]
MVSRMEPFIWSMSWEVRSLTFTGSFATWSVRLLAFNKPHAATKVIDMNNGLVMIYQPVDSLSDSQFRWDWLQCYVVVSIHQSVLFTSLHDIGSLMPIHPCYSRAFRNVSPVPSQSKRGHNHIIDMMAEIRGGDCSELLQCKISTNTMNHRLVIEKGVLTTFRPHTGRWQALMSAKVRFVKADLTCEVGTRML